MRRSLFATFAVVPALVFGGTAVAQPRATGCAGDWSDSGAECSFAYAGGDAVDVGLSVLGAPLGGGIVQLQKDGPLGRETILSCAVGGMWSACGAVQSSSEPFAAVGAPLYCVVTGRGGSGTYNCGSDSSDTGSSQGTTRVRRTRVAVRHPRRR